MSQTVNMFTICDISNISNNKILSVSQTKTHRRYLY